MPETPPNVYDPCAAYVRLKEAHEKVVLGQSVRRVRFRNGDEERETDFTPANLDALERAMKQAKGECMELTTGKPRRSAISIGYRGPLPGRIY